MTKKTKFRRVLYKSFRIDGSLRNRWLLLNSNELCYFKYAEIVNGTLKLACKKIFQRTERTYTTNCYKHQVQGY